MSTAVAREQDITRAWFVVDLEDVVLGRAATEIARILRGKHKPIYTPSVDTGDFVIVLNADKVRLTGNKLADKKYYNYSGYPGGLKEITAEKLLAKKPEMVVQAAVKGMLPKNKLGRKMFTKLKVYAGSDHPHMAQQPKELKITSREIS
ncbi:MAG: 50S ribosomal protein L13 [Pelovirga sp.]